jgi:rod shape-determining protein MreC
MPLGTLDREPPPFFRQGYSALSKLAVCSALAIFLMAADARFKLMQPVRVLVAAAIYPIQWLAMRPVLLLQGGAGYLAQLSEVQSTEDATRKQLALQALRVSQVEQLELENKRLRQLLALPPRITTTAQAAQVLYDAADPYTRKVIVNKGLAHKIALGSPVLDEYGVLGQVTQVYPMESEVTLITDRNHAIPVLNVRTGARGVAYGDTSTHADALELRYMATNADVAVGDLLATSGIDGIYPPGLPVAKIEKIERQVDAVFARIYCVPLALVSGTSHVLVLAPVQEQIPSRPVKDTP